MAPKFHNPFSPYIMETSVPKKFVDIVNRSGDDILSTPEKCAQFDWSHKLVDKIHYDDGAHSTRTTRKKEIQIPIANKEEKDYFFGVLQRECLNYLLHAREIGKANNWKRMAGQVTPTIKNIRISQSWLVSYHAGEFNSWHHHAGDLSAAIYLKIPEGMMKNTVTTSLGPRHAAGGMIEFCFGDYQDFRCDNLKFVPRSGKMFVWPSWLKHFVYPFTGEGERRMMALNAHMVV